MATQKSVKLPEHLWAALDDMSRDGAQPADALMELAVEQFVALQGYELPIGAAPVPQGLQHDDDEEPLEFAATAARPALARRATPEPPPPAEKPEPPVPEPVPEPVAAPNSTGLMPTHVPTKSKPGPSVADVVGAPAVTEQSPAHKPPRAKPSAPSAPPKPVPPPAWASRAALSDADEERQAVREHLEAIDRDLDRLTVERPTTTPLGQASGDDEAGS